MRRTAILLTAALFAASGYALKAPSYQAPELSRSECTIKGAAVSGVSLTSAKIVEADTRTSLPAHCQIDGKFEERIGAEGKPYAIAFQLRVPTDWNGRLLFQGGGGLNGTVNPALGAVIGASPNTGLMRGFAVVSTDSGHQGTDASFAADPTAKLNYAYASIGKVVVVAKRILTQVEGSKPKRTYYAGCSNGGREALLAAQRFPGEFDGVIAGSPAFNLGDAVLLAHYSTSVYRNTAPIAPDGAVQLPLSLLPAESKLLSEGVLKQCDALDGLRDGFIFNHAACDFNPRTLQCQPGQASSDCLSAAKVRMIQKAFAGPLDRHGRPLVSSWTYDSGISADSWRIWQVGLMGAGGKPALLLPRMIDETLARYFNDPMLDPTRLGHVDTARMRAQIAPTSAFTKASPAKMSSFAASGGKMLIVSGWSEPVFAPNDLLAWYRQLDRNSKAAGVPAPGFARLYMVPGMNHCGGGPSLDRFDALTALMDWVEESKAPDRIVATGNAYPGVSRPLCPYPKIARYRQGQANDASSFACTMPAAHSMK